MFSWSLICLGRGLMTFLSIEWEQKWYITSLQDNQELVGQWRPKIDLLYFPFIFALPDGPLLTAWPPASEFLLIIQTKVTCLVTAFLTLSWHRFIPLLQLFLHVIYSSFHKHLFRNNRVSDECTRVQDG